MATAFDYRQLKVQASVVGNYIIDNTNRNTSKKKDSQLTPALFANLYPFKGKWLSLRAYVKQSFRMPTFNDLYYTEIGSANLKPERATQFDFGFLLNKHLKATALSLQADIYYNKVEDKIIAYPKGQQFRWTMLNLGEVDIRGLDVVGSLSGTVFRDVTTTVRAQYTYQKAIDITNPSRPFYRHQIPYIPRHSGSLIVGVDWQRLSLNYSFLYTGERWNAQVNNDYNYMQPWYTSDFSASYRFKLMGCEMKALAEVNNLLDQQYDVIANYPMPGRNFGVGVEARF